MSQLTLTNVLNALAAKIEHDMLCQILSEEAPLYGAYITPVDHHFSLRVFSGLRP